MLATLFFDEFGLCLDNNQYHDMMLMASMFDFTMRKQKYIQHYPPKSSYKKEPLAWFKFAGRCILHEVHQKRQEWTWEYFAERRDDRKKYLELYTAFKLETITEEDKIKLQILERKLSFRDIRFYRSLASPSIKKKQALRKQQIQQNTQSSWTGYLWSWGTGQSQNKSEDNMVSDQQMQQLYETIDFDEDEALKTVEYPKEYVQFCLQAKLNKGSVLLRTCTNNGEDNTVNLELETFMIGFLERPDSYKATLTLDQLNLFDGTSKNTLYPQIIKVSEVVNENSTHTRNELITENDLKYLDIIQENSDPFIDVVYEHNPLTIEADDALSIKMRNLEVIYNPTVIESVLNFFTPPTPAHDSVTALMEAAGNTFEGLKKQTRAGLTYALEVHKTMYTLIDIQAPLLIFPHNCTDPNSLVVVLDSGHLNMISDLISPETKAHIQSKQGQPLTEELIEELHSLMYNKFTLDLNSVQLVIGQSVESCLEAVRNPDYGRDQHIVDRINMKLDIFFSILPKVSQFTKIKVTGNLPLLKINVSDRKYRAFMSTLNMLSFSSNNANQPQQPLSSSTSTVNSPQKRLYHKPSTGVLADLINRDDLAEDLLFSDSESGNSDDDDDDDQFFDAEDDTQKQIEEKFGNLNSKFLAVDFKIDQLKLSLRRANKDIYKDEVELAEAVLDGFKLDYTQYPHHMEVDILIEKLNIFDKLYPDSVFRHLITSEPVDKDETTSDHLVVIKYISVNEDSPEYISKYDSIATRLDVSFSTLSVIVTQKTILSLYFFLLETFVPQDTAPSQDIPADTSLAPNQATEKLDSQNPPPARTISITAKFNSIQLILNNNGVKLATARFLNGGAVLLMTPQSLRLTSTLANFFIINNIETNDSVNYHSFRQLLSLDGKQPAIFKYESFNNPQLDYDTAISVNMGSARITFLEEPIQQLLSFFSRFAAMHVLFNTARQAAAESAAQLQENANRILFDIKIASPYVVFPRNSHSKDTLVANLGEITINNAFPKDPQSKDPRRYLNHMILDITNIRLTSLIYFPEFRQSLQIIDDVDIRIEMTSCDHISGSARPDMEITCVVSDVVMNLTRKQYQFIMNILESISKAFSPNTDSKDLEEITHHDVSNLPISDDPNNVIDQIQQKSDSQIAQDTSQQDVWTTLDIEFKVDKILLELFDGDDIQPKKLHESRLVLFSLNKTLIKYMTTSQNRSEMEASIHSFIVQDTRTDHEYSFREIIPAITHEGPQFMAHMKTAPQTSSFINVTVDSPVVVLAIDFMFAIKEFALSPFNEENSESPPQNSKSAAPNSNQTQQVNPEETTEYPLQYRVNVIDSQIIVLADLKDPSSEAIVLGVGQILIHQENVLNLSVDHISMSLCQMNARDQTALKFIEDFDLNVVIDDRITKPGHHLTSMGINVKPLILRLSYRDVMLITDVVNRFSQLLGNSDPEASNASETAVPSNSTDSYMYNSKSNTYYQLLSRETLQITMQGLQIILIRDAFDMPILDINASSFNINVTDWSHSLKAETQIPIKANYFNLNNSNWEPLIEPWSFGLLVTSGKDQPMKIEVQSKRQFDFNITPTVIESSMSLLEELSIKNPLTNARGVHVPYIIKNRTGYPIHIWVEGSNSDHDIKIHKVEDGDDLPWRFDDWRKARESVVQSKHRLCIQFENASWQRLMNIPVDRAGESVHILTPSINDVFHKLICEVQLKDHTKIVTFRSPLIIHNSTVLPVEFIVVDSKGSRVSGVTTVAPGAKSSVPIEHAYRFGIKVRPSAGYGYAWSEKYFYWREFLVGEKINSISCAPYDSNNSDFRFQIDGHFHVSNPIVANYPFITFKLSAPIEIENLLPFDIKYRIQDKSGGPEWSSSLEKGALAPIHVIDSSHLLLLTLQISNTDYRTSELVAIHSPGSNGPTPANQITLLDSSGLQLTLNLHYTTIPDSGGAFKLSIYCPYVILNKTGMDICFKTPSVVRTSRVNNNSQNQYSTSDVQPFLFSYGSGDNRRRAMVKIGNADWSVPVSFEASGTVSELTLRTAHEQEELYIGFSVNEGVGKYHLSKIVTFTPRFIITNKLQEAIDFRDIAIPQPVALQPGDKSPLYFLSHNGEKQLTIRFAGNSRWSAPFKIDEVGKVHLRISKDKGDMELIRIRVQLEGPVLFISFEKEEGKWPFRIENLYDADITFYQSNSLSRQSSGAAEGTKYRLPAGRIVPYSWDYPSEANKLLVISVNGFQREIDFQEIGVSMPFKFKMENQSHIMSIEVKAEGLVMVLKLTPYRADESVFKPTYAPAPSTNSNPNPTSTHTTITRTGTTQGFEIVQAESKISFTFQVKLEGIGISLINRRNQELIYATLRGLDFKFENSDVSQSVSLCIKWIQVDNQLYGALYPIILYPTEIPKHGNESNLHPALRFIAVKTKDESYGVEFYKYVTFLIQAMSFEVDEDFLFALLDFAKYSIPGAEIENNHDDDLNPHSMEIVEPKAQEDEHLSFFEVFHVQPLKLNISFTRTERINQEESPPPSHNPITFLFNVLTMTIGSINDAPIKFNALVLENLLATYPVLINRFSNYYSQEFLFQIHKIVGSADVIGNPVGLFNNLSSGVVDIFYEPYQGFVMSDRPQDFGIGLAKGTSSFVKKTVFGLSDSLSKITESLGKGLSVVTMDKAFQDKRRMTRVRNRPKHALYGVAQGAESFGSSVASGLTGVLMRPIEGAEKEGVGGFFKGIGKGLVGAVAKPVVGVFDLASNVAEGIRNTTTVFDGIDIDRVRLTRYIGPDGVLKPYSQREALGQSWLREVKDGKYFSENYIAHYDLRSSQNVIMLTGNRVLLLRSKQLTLEWDIALSELHSVSIVNNGIQFVLNSGEPGPFIPIVEAAARKWFFAKVEEAHNQYRQSNKPLE
jgi:vacuolar protein sorting-associated protein 13A/C